MILNTSMRKGCYERLVTALAHSELLFLLECASQATSWSLLHFNIYFRNPSEDINDQDVYLKYINVLGRTQEEHEQRTW